MVVEDIPGDIRVHNWLAAETAYLVKTPAPSIAVSIASMRALYLDRGFGKGRLIDPEALATALEMKYGPDFLAWLGYPAWTDDSPSPWVRSFLFNSKNECKRATIEYLLLLGIVADSTQHFLEQLNEARQHDDRHGHTVNCSADVDCGNVLRSALDASNFCVGKAAAKLGKSPYWVAAEAMRQNVRIPLSLRVRSQLGDAKLERIRFDLSAGVSKCHVHRAYGISEWTVMLIVLDDPTLRTKGREANAVARKDFHRHQILEFMSESANPTRQALHKSKSATYEFMLAFDLQWFACQLAPKRINSRTQHDTKKDLMSDAAISEQLLELSRSLRSSSGRPARITKTLLLRTVGKISTYYGHHDRFSRTTEILSNLCETEDAYHERRILWAIQQIAMGTGAVSINRLRRVASLSAPRLRAKAKFVTECADRFEAKVHSDSYFSSIEAGVRPCAN